MLKKIKQLLRGPLPTVAALDKASASIDLPALEAGLAEARKKRAALLLDGSVDAVLAAERAVDTARIELERGHAALAEIDRRRQEAEAKAAREELERRHAEVQGQVDAAVAKIEAEYPKHAAAIAELAALAKQADAAAHDWLTDVIGEKAEDLAIVDPVAKRLGWHDEFFSPPYFSDAPLLPPVGDFCGYGDERAFVTHVRHYAVAGAGTGGDLVRGQQERGPRWGRL